MIEVKGLYKYYQVHEREPGFRASLRSLFHRKFRHLKLLIDISFPFLKAKSWLFLVRMGLVKRLR